ncbi:hypothetical protein AC578_4227 [Pseudocercospora eumusae]|uniref:Uncharacterized protein n=1 Tax=Pseudocercospora eumusae TaxID=321146 RepID=A0A139H361_9PEZI|nr:hypothetical protein AC578_4227 [Pseudocercospora eumusae]
MAILLSLSGNYDRPSSHIAQITLYSRTWTTPNKLFKDAAAAALASASVVEGLPRVVYHAHDLDIVGKTSLDIENGQPKPGLYSSILAPYLQTVLPTGVEESLQG